MTRVITIVRTLNEERNIEQFVRSHRHFSDLILVADGGSTDGTLSILGHLQHELRYDEFEIQVRHFDEKVTNRFGQWKNPEGNHINFLISWAKAEQADWIVSDDPDHQPNLHLNSVARTVFEIGHLDAFYAKLIYLWGTTHFFPDLNNCKPAERLWAWKPSVHDLWANPTILHVEFPVKRIPKYESEHTFVAKEPAVVLHHSWPDRQAVYNKMKYYHAWGGKMRNPLRSCGPLEKLPKEFAE